MLTFVCENIFMFRMYCMQLSGGTLLKTKPLNFLIETQSNKAKRMLTALAYFLSLFTWLLSHKTLKFLLFMIILETQDVTPQFH